jgi:hydrogenase/urease accessory protein HupE
MPQIFKALASVAAWSLWIIAWVIGISSLVHGIIIGELFGPKPPAMSFLVAFAIALGYAIGSIIIVVLRKKLE